MHFFFSQRKSEIWNWNLKLKSETATRYEHTFLMFVDLLPAVLWRCRVFCFGRVRVVLICRVCFWCLLICCLPCCGANVLCWFVEFVSDVCWFVACRVVARSCCVDLSSLFLTTIICVFVVLHKWEVTFRSQQILAHVVLTVVFRSGCLLCKFS
jgi:hypothetical protein